jgi:hypothetical protein
LLPPCHNQNSPPIAAFCGKSGFRVNAAPDSASR